jgi:hypothetical protein
MIDDHDGPEAMRPFCNLWKEKFELAKKHKRDAFGKFADEARLYYVGPHDHVFKKDGADKWGKPTYEMTFNKVYELVSLFGPLLYHRNPVRVVTTRPKWKPGSPPQQAPMAPPGPPMQPPPPGMPPPPPGPAGAMPGGPGAMPPPGPLSGAIMGAMGPPQPDMQDQLLRDKASILEMVLNYTPNELDLKGHMRLAIDEALVKGRGTLWSETYTPPNSKQKLVGSFFHSVDELLIDPDLPSLEKSKWIAKECCAPVWEVEREYGMAPGSLKATLESSEAAAAVNNGSTSEEKKQGKTADLVKYWKVWSKMGLGVRLKPKQMQNVLGELSQVTEVFGDYVYLVICPKCPYPLNIPAPLVDARRRADISVAAHGSRHARPRRHPRTGTRAAATGDSGAGRYAAAGA